MYRRCSGDVGGNSGLRSQIWLLGCLLSATVLQGCSSDDPLTGFNSWAEIELDGYTLDEEAWDTSGQSVSCERESDGGPLVRVVDAQRWPEDPTEWLVGGTEIAMRLELPDARGEASIELTIGDAVYRSDAGTKTTVQPRPGDRGTYRNSTGGKWRIEGPVGGRAAFRRVPLTSGEPFDGKERLERVVVEWDCLGRPSKPAKFYSRS